MLDSFSFVKKIYVFLQISWRANVLTAFLFPQDKSLSLKGAQPRHHHGKHPAHSCVVGCKEGGGGLTYGDSLNSSGKDDNVFVCLFVA